MKRILVVEDHDLLLLAIRDILEVEGYEVITGVDGLDGLEKMKEFPPDLIVADISMPRMDGYQFFEAVRERPEWVLIPFIFLTARAEREDRLKGKSMGAEDYITKPFDPQELVVVVNSRIGRARAIRQAAETEFDELKQQIITLLSHELRTPLTSVYGYTELALEEATGLPPGDFQQFLMGIKKGADRLTRLVEDLLMMVRLESGQLEREFRLLGSVHDNVNTAVEQAVKLNRVMAQRKDIVIHFEPCPEPPPVKIYEHFLVDAVGRLIDNAIKFSRKKGKAIYVKVTNDDSHVQIDITDEGIGIAAAQLSQIFESFRQINRAKMEQQGTGLGLVIAQSQVECMQGTITAQSVLGEGSTFSIRIPITSERA